METEPCKSRQGFLKVHTCSKSKRVPENVGKGASATHMRSTPRLGEVRMRIGPRPATSEAGSAHAPQVLSQPRKRRGPERSGLAQQPAFRQWKLCHEDPFLGLGPVPYGLAVSIAPLESPRVKLNESQNCPPPRGLSAAEEIGEVYWLVGMRETGYLGLRLGHHGCCSFGGCGPDKALRPASLGGREKSLAQESHV